jgi:outer membrane protein assembly factor BamB
MRASAIRELAASRDATKVAAAFFEKTVQIWDLKTRERRAEFETVFTFGGGGRLALDAAGQKCVTAGWGQGKRGGVACYDADTGELIWHRQDLRQTQFVRFSSRRGGFWCFPESGRTRLLDPDNGSDVDSVAGFHRFYESEYSGELLLERRKRDYILKNGEPRKIPRITFAILEVAFGTQSFVVSEAGGPVRCIDSSAGIELWRFTPEKGSHFLHLWFRSTDGNFYGVLRHYEQNLYRRLVRLDAATGEAKIVCDLDSWYEAYCAKLDYVVSSSGDLVDLAEGRVLHRLNFPQRDYPQQ